MIFTILVSFLRDNALFASNAKNLQTTLILVFEVIVQPPKTHFLTFSSETKIMKITYSVLSQSREIIIYYLLQFILLLQCHFIFFYLAILLLYYIGMIFGCILCSSTHFDAFFCCSYRTVLCWQPL